MNIVQLYQDFGLFIAPENHKHYREGWVNVTCPFCSGNPGYHLGWHEEDEYFVCWRCGGHHINETFSRLLNININEVHSILKKYNKFIITEKKDVKIKLQPFKLPSGTQDNLEISHRKYLLKRNFDPDEIQRIWKIKATTTYGKLDDIDYKHRIIIPIYWNDEVVTFQGRDITDKHPMKYLACPENREIKNIKTILYGNQNKWTDLGICVEGVTDVWRFGESSCGIFGIKFKSQQVRVLAKTFKRVAVVFDDDSQAKIQAKKLVSELLFRGVDAFSVTINGDPGGMEQDEADNFVRNLQTFKIK